MAFMGMRGTGDWVTDERPKNWREGILLLYPNGDAPLTAILSKLPEQSVDDPEFNWWTKTLAAQGGPITDVYTDAVLSATYTSGAVAGTTLFVKVTEAVASEFVVGKEVLLSVVANQAVDVVGKATAVVKNGANSYIAVRLLEPDDNGGAVTLGSADYIQIIGSIHPEGAPMPDPVAYDPDKLFNYTQIFRNSLSITNTAKETRLRTVEAYREMKREALQYHSIEMERAFIWGIRTENIGANGKPERTTMGLIPCIKQYASANISDFSLSAAYSGDTWLESGEEWLDAMLEQIFRFGATEKMVFAGSGALLGINKLAKASGQIQIQPTTASYGLKVNHWITPFGDIYLKRHPLFSYSAKDRNSMVIFEPSALRYRYVRNRDTKFIDDDGKHGITRLDATNEEFLTECGLEFHHPIKFGYLTGLNTDNTVV